MDKNGSLSIAAASETILSPQQTPANPWIAGKVFLWLRWSVEVPTKCKPADMIIGTAQVPCVLQSSFPRTSG